MASTHPRKLKVSKVEVHSEGQLQEMVTNWSREWKGYLKISPSNIDR